MTEEPKTKNQKLKTASGFTLIEMLIYVALVATIISAVTLFGVWAMQVGAKAKANQEVLDNARRALEIMAYEIKKATGLYAPTSVFEASPGQLSLETASPTGLGESSSYADFFVCGQALCLKREKTNALALTSDSVRVTKLLFEQRLNDQVAPSIKITLGLATATSTRPEKTASLELNTTANLRSY